MSFMASLRNLVLGPSRQWVTDDVLSLAVDRLVRPEMSPDSATMILDASVVVMIGQLGKEYLERAVLDRAKFSLEVSRRTRPRSFSSQ